MVAEKSRACDECGTRVGWVIHDCIGLVRYSTEYSRTARASDGDIHETVTDVGRESVTRGAVSSCGRPVHHRFNGIDAR
jgi:hypothetical protein